MPECNAPKCFYVCRDAPAKKHWCCRTWSFEGYEPFDKCIFVDDCHIEVALHSLAQFHACSFVMKERDRKTYNEAIKFCEPMTLKSQNRYLGLLEHRLGKAFENFERTCYEPILQSLSKNLVKFIEAISRTGYTCIVTGSYARRIFCLNMRYLAVYRRVISF